MKILCTADIHIGQQAYSTIDSTTGLNNRILHSLSIFDEMIDYILNNNIEVFAFAGDLYKNNLPSPTIQDEVNKRFKRLSDNNIHTFIIDGNHDVSKLSTSKSAMKTYDTFSIPNIIHSKFFNKHIYKSKDGRAYQFIMLPTYTTKEELIDLINNIDYTLPTIFIGHLTIRGALLNDWLIEDKEEYIDKDIFNKPNVKAVILGHLHKYQVINIEPLIFYTGSPDRIDFTEEKQNKGFVILDINNTVKYNFIENNAEKFFTLKLDIENELDYNEYIIKQIQLSQLKIKNSIFRLIVKLNLQQILDDKAIYMELNKYSPKYVLDIQKNYTSKRYNRNSNITNELSIEKNIEIYYNNKDRGKERIKLGKEICQQYL